MFKIALSSYKSAQKPLQGFGLKELHPPPCALDAVIFFPPVLHYHGEEANDDRKQSSTFNQRNQRNQEVGDLQRMALPSPVLGFIAAMGSPSSETRAPQPDASADSRRRLHRRPLSRVYRARTKSSCGTMGP